jgi:hypothetical protein
MNFSCTSPFLRLCKLFAPIFLLFITELGNAQSTFLQVQDANTVVLTGNEQTKLTNVLSDQGTQANWFVSTDNLANSLNGRTLSVSFPNEVPVSFEADFPFSKGPNDYYWMGYNLDGSYFRIIKRPNEIFGSAYIAASRNHYKLISISSSKSVLVKYTPPINREIADCGTNSVDEADNDEVEDRSGCETNRIRVLFLHTPAVTNATPSPTSVSLNVIADLNATTMASGIPQEQVFFEYAGTAVLPGFIESTNISTDLTIFRTSPVVHNLRDTYYADIVMLLTAPYNGGIIGQAAGVSNEKAYCISQLNVAAALFTGTHEVGHILKAWHQRPSQCNGQGDNNLSLNHGFPVGSTMKTMMTQLICPHPTRITRWSNPDKDFMGIATGDFFNNNAKAIKSRAKKTACFRGDPPSLGGGSSHTFVVAISGPEKVPNTPGYYPYQSSITASSAIVYPLTYLWEVSNIGVGNYTTVGTSSSWVLNNPATLPGNWTTLRLTVTDAANHTAQDFFEIQRN